jgi:hypothetical protein
MRGNPYVFNQLGSGVNLEAAPYSLDTGQAREALNARTSPLGAIVKRNGCEPIAEPSATLTSLFGCNLGTDVLIAAGSTNLYKITTGGTVSTLKEGVSNGIQWEWIQAPESGGQGPIYGVNGTNTPQYWDGEAAETKDWTASEGSIPNGKFILYHENRVWIAKGSTLYWSDIIDPRNFESPKGGSTQIDPEDGEEITGLGKVGPYLLVFKERKTFIVFDSNTGAYRRISDRIGCIANRSIVSTESGTFFISSDGEIVLTDGNDFDTKIGLAISPLFVGFTGTQMRKACGVYSEGSVYLSFTTKGSTNDTIIEFNLNNSSWWVHNIYYSESQTGGVTQFTIIDPSDATTLYGAGANSSVKRVFKMFVENRYKDVVAFNTYWISPWHVFTYPHLRKRMREIRVDALGTYTLYTARSFQSIYEKETPKNWESSGEGTIFGGEGEFGGEGKFGGDAIIVEKRFYTPGQGRAWSLKFESENDQALEIYSYTTSVTYKKD